MAKIPHRLYLTEDQMPTQWYNLRADMKEQPDPMIEPGHACSRAGVEDLYPDFLRTSWPQQEMDGTTRYIDIPGAGPARCIRCYRPSPLMPGV